VANMHVPGSTAMLLLLAGGFFMVSSCNAFELL
jgi:hypothetical protein